MRSSSSPLKAGTSIQSNPNLQTDFALINTVSGALVIAIPLVMVCAIVSYQKYRATIRRRQIKLLNHLWQLDTSQKLP